MNISLVRGGVLSVMVVFIAFFTACSEDHTAITPTQPAVQMSSVTSAQSQGEDRTPFQHSVIETIAERRAQGLPVPADVSFEYYSTKDIPMQTAQGLTIVPGEKIVITAKTVLHFEHPSEAGNDRWPALVIEGDVPPNATGYIKAGDYSKLVRSKVEEEVPDIWTRYEWGYEPRTYTFSETYTITYPELNLDDPALTQAALSTKVGQMLMGFTLPGPNLDYSVSWDFEILGVKVIDFWAGFELDWGLGVRLPMEESCTATEPMVEGTTYWPTNKAKGLDWSATDFANAGVPPEDGNEFVMEFVFKFGVFLEVSSVDVIDLGVDIDIDHSKSFTTPFGPGSTFPLPSLDIPLWSLDVGVAYGEIGFQLTPHLGSEKLTANWTATGDASGSGAMMFTDPAVPVTIGPVMAIDGPGIANINMDNCRYYFNVFLLDLGLFFYLDVFGVWDGTFTVPIVDFDLSVITGNLWVGTHGGTPDQLTAAFAIQNVPPTAVIDRTGTFLVNGMPTFIAQVGDALTFTGQADDPGFDDLTLIWDFDDGDPSPDVSTHYTVPYHVSEAQTWTVGDACVYMVGFKAVDDDGAVGMDEVPVVITATWAKPRSEGYWQHQLNLRGNRDLDITAIECALDIVSHMSAVFSEVRNASTVVAAYDVMHLKQNYDSLIEQLDRELLAVWLNFAMGACPYMGTVDTDGDGFGDAAFADALTTAEEVRMDPGSTDAELLRQIEILHQINNGGMGRITNMTISQ
jgi:hypothetical protein